MKSSRNPVKVSTLALGLAMLVGSSAAQAQQFYVWQNPWGPTYHNLSFTSVSNVQDITSTQLVLFQGYVQVKAGFSFVGTTSSGQSYTVQVLVPGGNILGSRVGRTEADIMETVVTAFRDSPASFSALHLERVEKYFYGPYTMTTNSRMKIQVASPQASVHGGTSGGLVELEVNGGNNDFYVESVIRRNGSCGGGAKDSRLSVLRNQRSFILNGQTQSTVLSPASIGVAELFLERALESVGTTVLDVSGARKLEEDPPYQDPYHLSRGRCASTYVIDSYSYINIRTLRNSN